MKGKDGKHMKKEHHASKQHVEMKKGGKIKSSKKAKHVGKVEGHKAKERLDRPKRAMGGKAGGKMEKMGGGERPYADGMSAASPFSSATKTEKDVEGEKDVAMKKGGRLTADKRKK
jgi:hypothetical protein